MSLEDNFSLEVREKLKKIVRETYKDFSQLYPALSIDSLSNEQLFKIAGEQKPIQEVLGEPEIPTIYHSIRTGYPELQRQYPDLDLFSLSESQLERLARGEHPEKVLDPSKHKPAYETLPLSKAQTSRKPAIGNHYSSKGSSRIPDLKINSSRRGVNPSGDDY